MQLVGGKLRGGSVTKVFIVLEGETSLIIITHSHPKNHLKRLFDGLLMERLKILKLATK